MKYWSAALLATGAMLWGTMAHAATYVVDREGAHAFIQFRIKHLGYSWLYGRFNDFKGEFTFDEKDPSKNSITMEVDTNSLDSNHAQRDKHLRSGDFLDTKKYPKATFKSTSYKSTGDSKGELAGELTLHGVTKPITIEVEHIGGGKDPWGGYRQGFEGRATIKPADFGMDVTKKLGASAEEVELMLSIEGIRKDKK